MIVVFWALGMVSTAVWCFTKDDDWYRFALLFYVFALMLAVA